MALVQLSLVVTEVIAAGAYIRLWKTFYGRFEAPSFMGVANWFCNNGFALLAFPCLWVLLIAICQSNGHHVWLTRLIFSAGGCAILTLLVIFGVFVGAICSIYSIL